MRRIAYLLAALLMLAATGCKTTEKNYQEAYEIAKQKKQAADDDMQELTGGKLITNARTINVPLGTDTLATRVEYVRVVKADKPDEPIQRYNVIVGQFRQIFNARAMAERLTREGYKPFILQNNTPAYYVVAGSYGMAIDAFNALKAVKVDKNVTLLPPCPWVLQPAQMVR